MLSVGEEVRSVWQGGCNYSPILSGAKEIGAINWQTYLTPIEAEVFFFTHNDRDEEIAANPNEALADFQQRVKNLIEAKEL